MVNLFQFKLLAITDPTALSNFALTRSLVLCRVHVWERHQWGSPTRSTWWWSSVPHVAPPWSRRRRVQVTCKFRDLISISIMWTNQEKKVFRCAFTHTWLIESWSENQLSLNLVLNIYRLLYSGLGAGGQPPAGFLASISKQRNSLGSPVKVEPVMQVGRCI